MARKSIVEPIYFTHTPLSQGGAYVSLYTIKRDPEIAQVRQKMADGYRIARRTNPALARLLFKRVKAAEKETVERVSEKLFSARFP